MKSAVRGTTRGRIKGTPNDQNELPFSRPDGASPIAGVAADKSSLLSLRQAAAGCRGCDLWKHATQTVFGEGSPRATIMFVGEQPGDREDLAGRPFVGPAGNLLDEALREANIDRSKVYVTNVVKHFKWVPSERGKRRIHKKPSYSEILACRPWLDAEIRLIKPQILVCLGELRPSRCWEKPLA